MLDIVVEGVEVGMIVAVAEMVWTAVVRTAVAVGSPVAGEAGVPVAELVDRIASHAALAEVVDNSLLQALFQVILAPLQFPSPAARAFRGSLTTLHHLYWSNRGRTSVQNQGKQH